MSIAQASTSPGWILIAAPSAPLSPSTAGRSSQRQPTANARNSNGPTWPSLSAYRNGHDRPASSTITHRVRIATGMTATPAPNDTPRRAVHTHVATPAGSNPNASTSGMNVGG